MVERTDLALAADYPDLSLVTRPLYGYAEADQLAGVSRGTARRWLAGPTSLGGKIDRATQPSTTLEAESAGAVSFVDLVEIVAIGGLKEAGFSLRFIRQIVRDCQALLGIPRPLTALKLRADGRAIFVGREEELLKSAGRRGQATWYEVLEPLLANLDYEHGVARRWWPLGRANHVVVDPEYGYGLPVVANSGVRTEIIRERFEAGDLRAQIAEDFNLDPIEVERALQFELKRAA